MLGFIECIGLSLRSVLVVLIKVLYTHAMLERGRCLISSVMLVLYILD